MRSRYVRDERRSIVDGMDDVRELELRSRYVRDERRPIAGGIDDVRTL